jgi:PAP2 superfamily C-terminal
MNSAAAPVRPRWQAVVFRAAFVGVGLLAWFWTQALIGGRAEPANSPSGIGDGIHDLLATPHQFLVDHPGVADILLICSSAVIDLVGVSLLAVSIFGSSVRPFLGLLLVFMMRQICQMLCALPPPTGMIWRYPGFPALLVTYDVATDFFFSGHTALAVLGAVELTRILGRRWLLVGLLLVLFEASTVLLVRAHYTMDVFTGAVAARYATILAQRWAPWCDRWLGGGR